MAHGLPYIEKPYRYHLPYIWFALHMNCPTNCNNHTSDLPYMLFTLPSIILPYTGLPYMRNLAWIVINITSFLPYIMFALPFIILPYTCLPYMRNLVRIVIIITPQNFKFVTVFYILPLWLLLRLSSMFIFTSPYYLFYLSTYLYTALYCNTCITACFKLFSTHWEV